MGEAHLEIAMMWILWEWGGGGPSPLPVNIEGESHSFDIAESEYDN